MKAYTVLSLYSGVINTRNVCFISVSTVLYLVCMAVLVTGSLVLLVLALYCTVPCMYGCPGYREPGSEYQISTGIL